MEARAKLVSQAVEQSLAKRVSAPFASTGRAIERIPFGIAAVDAITQGIPLAAITELVGSACSGRTSATFQLLRRFTVDGGVCAWVDVADALDPMSAAANGVDLNKLLWVRCAGVDIKPVSSHGNRTNQKPWHTLDQALRTTDLLLTNGGFAAIVLDLGSTPAEFAWRIPLATWFRYRAACERSRCSLLLLTQYPCARSSAGLVVRMQPGMMEADGPVMSGVCLQADVERSRFTDEPQNVIPIRKPPQAEREGAWKSEAVWA